MRNTVSPTLSIGEKIKEIRRTRGFSQENLANAIGRSITFISRLENNDAELDNKTLEAIKEYMGIEKAPLLELELELYRNRLWTWSELLYTGRWSDAEALQEELSPILYLHYEHELVMLYKMILSRRLLHERDYSTVEEYLCTVESALEETSMDIRFLFHRHKSELVGVRYDHVNCLSHALKALEIGDENQIQDTRLVCHIGRCYINLGQLINALQYLERARREFSPELPQQFLCMVDTMTTHIYLHLGELDKAKKVLDITIIRAKGLNDKPAISLAQYMMGLVCYRMGNFKECIEFFDEALTFFQDAPDAIGVKTNHIGILIGKAYGLFALKDYSGFDDALSQAQTLAEGDEGLLIQVVGVRHLATLNDSSSIDYLESVAIPFYRANGGRFIMAALDACKALEAYYRKKRATKKADAIAIIIRDIYEEMIFGPGNAYDGQSGVWVRGC
ncbi:MAG: helix-turn-helix transcriptional regulator [Defluviitaleaceae bacterium]|nr:helix-turn-helix transcriptional regulator [Defluviitaleaceae bacterium]